MLSRYLQGMQKVRLQMDHKPLVPLIKSYDLDKVPIRCQRLLMRLMKFNAEACHVPGKQLIIADMSRKPLPDGGGASTEEDVTAYVQALMELRPITRDQLDTIRQATIQDGDLQTVSKYVSNGWPKEP